MPKAHGRTGCLELDRGVFIQEMVVRDGRHFAFINCVTSVSNRAPVICVHKMQDDNIRYLLGL